jgi:hypothetical protein
MKQNIALRMTSKNGPPVYIYIYILYLYIQNIHVYGPLIIMLYTRAYYNDDVQKTIIILYRFNSVRPRPVLYVFLKLLLIEIYSARMKIN